MLGMLSLGLSIFIHSVAHSEILIIWLFGVDVLFSLDPMEMFFVFSEL